MEATNENTESNLLEKNKEQLYDFLSNLFQEDRETIKKSVISHPESHTIEIWKENLGDAFPSVLIIIWKERKRKEKKRKKRKEKKRKEKKRKEKKR